MEWARLGCLLTPGGACWQLFSLFPLPSPLTHCFFCSCPRGVYLTRAYCSCGLPLEVCNNCNCLWQQTRVFHLAITVNNSLCESVRKPQAQALCVNWVRFFLLLRPLIDRHLCFIYSLIPAGLAAREWEGIEQPFADYSVGSDNYRNCEHKLIYVGACAAFCRCCCCCCCIFNCPLSQFACWRMQFYYDRDCMALSHYLTANSKRKLPACNGRTQDNCQPRGKLYHNWAAGWVSWVSRAGKMFSLACFGIGSGCRDVSVWFGFGFGFGFGLVSFQLRNLWFEWN